MKPLLIALLALFAFSQAWAYFVDCECPKYAGPIPGVDVLASGFDVTQLAAGTDRSFKSRIFTFTYNDQKCTRDTLGGDCYFYPDDMSPPIENDEQQSDSVNGYYSYSNEYVSTYSESYQSSIGIKTSYFGAAYDYHKELYDSQSKFSSGYVAQGYGFYVERLYTLVAPPAYILKLDPTFELALGDLPSKVESESDQIMYDQFLSSYGGYYVIDVIEGGRWHLNQYIDSYSSQTYSQSWETEQMGIEFNAVMFQMKTGQAANSSQYQTSEDYQKHSSVDIYCKGGDVQLECGSNEWMLSIVNFPSYINITFAPIYTLIYDDVDKRNTLETQTNYYTTHGTFPTFN
jgi:hypothetical protein